MLHRIFIAINLPPQIKNILASYQREFQERFSSLENSQSLVKWVLPDNFHITLEFLGNVSNQEIMDIENCCKEVALKNEPFNLILNGISFGPLSNYEEWGRKIPKFIWVRGEPSSQLNKLFQDLDSALFIQKKESRVDGINSPREGGKMFRFSPHITLARLRQWQFKRIEFDERPQIKEEINLSFRVNSIQIVESYLKKKGPIYTVLESIDLGSTSHNL